MAATRSDPAPPAPSRVRGALATVLGGRLRWRLARAGMFVAASVVYLAPALGLCPPLVIRQTADSMPKGFYVYAGGPPVARGVVIVVREPPRFAERWLMKRAAGVAGDRFCRRPDLGTHTLNGRRMPPPHPDAARLGLSVWAGCRELRPGEVVGYGRSPDSYDSRYIGPVREDDLWGVYRSVWVGS